MMTSKEIQRGDRLYCTKGKLSGHYVDVASVDPEKGLAQVSIVGQDSPALTHVRLDHLSFERPVARPE